MSDVQHSPLYTMNQARRRNAEAGQKFFEADTLRWRRSRVSKTAYPAATGGLYFVTSEQQGDDHPRLYTVRYIEPNGHTHTIGDFQGYANRASAHRAAKLLAHASRRGEAQKLVEEERHDVTPKTEGGARQGNIPGWRMVRHDSGGEVLPGTVQLNFRGEEFKVLGVSQAPQGNSTGRVAYHDPSWNYGDGRMDCYPAVFGLVIVPDESPAS